MSIDSAWQVFLAGTAGGCLLELLHWYGLRQSGKLPDYARSPFYWIVTIVMALAGGSLAWLYFGDKADAVVALAQVLTGADFNREPSRRSLCDAPPSEKRSPLSYVGFDPDRVGALTGTLD